MARSTVCLLSLLACLPLAAQGDHAPRSAQERLLGTWQAMYKDQVICTIRVKAGDQISGETDNCNLNIDGNGDVKEPDSSASSDGPPDPMQNARIRGDILAFEEKDGDDVLKFELKMVGDGKAELTILESPVPVKPIHFTKKPQ
jgi:hypothetical protein